MSWAAWKSHEKKVAETLGGKRRVARTANYRLMDWDVEVPDFPHWRIDCKHRKAQPFRHHSMVRDIKQKYCQAGEVPVLVTKNGNEHGEYVTMELKDFAAILNALRAVRTSPD